jgi:general secretion pathway protein A
MYHSYFGLREQPFSIAVNPRYLFMSARHRDALAHLLYGVGAGGGFILLTGEVGTGKTTINRALMEQLPAETDIAVILNPALNADELLASVCDEFKIDYNHENYTLKSLTDKLHEFLMENHGNGRNTVLLIDEAQHLQFDVLEQIRLLTNLETNTRKLLQIILIGQPELSEMLSRPELRQLNQRITARYELQPLNREETDAYIRHRLQVAGLPASQEIFPAAVVREIHRLTHGIPRLINILCDRVLLGAYGHNESTISLKTLRQAAVEVFGADQLPRSTGPARGMVAALLVGAVLAGLLWLVMQDRPPAVRQAQSVVTAPPVTAAQAHAGAQLAPEPQSMPRTPQTNDTRQTSDTLPGIAETRSDTASVDEDNSPMQVAELVVDESLTAPAMVEPALESVGERPDTFLYQVRWEALTQLARYMGTREYGDCTALLKVGWRCHEQKAQTWDELLSYNQPAVLSLVTPGRFARFAVLVEIRGDQAVLKYAGEDFLVSLAEIGRQWQGGYLFVWRPPDAYRGAISLGDTGPLVSWLAQEFADIDGQSTPLANDTFNRALDKRVRMFQRRYGLLDDGVVGVKTLLRLSEQRGLGRVLQQTLDAASAAGGQ